MTPTKTTYKKINIPWIGEIPEHWEVRRLKYCIDIIQTGSTPKSSNHKFHFDNGKINWFSPSDMNKDFIDNSKRKVTQNAVEDGVVSVFPIKSILITCIGDIGKVSMLKEKGSFNQQINGLIFQKGINSKYSFYYLKSQKDKLKSLANFTVLSILSTKELLGLKIPLPPLSEQTTIAAYLDRQVEKINHFIKKKRQYIALLKEQRQAIINQAVTQGINPNAALKNSDIEGLGEIPEHWEVRRLKNIVDYEKGKVPKNFSEDSTKQPYLTMDYPRGKDENVIYVEDDEKNVYVEKDDILVLWDGANAGEIIKAKKGCLSSTMALLKTNEKYFHKSFFYYFLKAKEGYFKDMANGTTIPHLDPDAFFNKPFGIPPKQEQTAIVSYIQVKTVKIDRAIAKAQKEMELIWEYKEAMIAEAVLGKLIIPKS